MGKKEAQMSAIKSPCMYKKKKRMLQSFDNRLKYDHLRNKSSAKTCCTSRINTIIHVSTQSATNNNIKWVADSLKEVQANVITLESNYFKIMEVKTKIILTITYLGLSSGKEAVH